MITENLKALKENYSNICVIANAFSINAICDAKNYKIVNIGVLDNIWPLSKLPNSFWRHKKPLEKLKLRCVDEHRYHVQYIVNNWTC